LERGLVGIRKDRIEGDDRIALAEFAPPPEIKMFVTTNKSIAMLYRVFDSSVIGIAMEKEN
jgi:hypothetical protein